MYYEKKQINLVFLPVILLYSISCSKSDSWRDCYRISWFWSTDGSKCLCKRYYPRYYYRFGWKVFFFRSIWCYIGVQLSWIWNERGCCKKQIIDKCVFESRCSGFGRSSSCWYYSEEEWFDRCCLKCKCQSTGGEAGY